MTETIIEGLRQFILKCPLLEDYTHAVGVDYLDKEAGFFSIEVTPCNTVEKTYLRGPIKKQYQFTFVSRALYGRETMNQIENLAFYERFERWLNDCNKKRVFPELPDGMQVQSIVPVSSGYIMAEEADKARYQIQCKLTYFTKG